MTEDMKERLRKKLPMEEAKMCIRDSVQTVGHSAVAFFQEVSGVVDGNGVQPCVKGALSIKVAQGPGGFGERFLGDVIGLSLIHI